MWLRTRNGDGLIAGDRNGAGDGHGNENGFI